MDRDDLAALCAGMTRDEVDRVHRLLHQWDVGPEDSFPVQLALLTAVQLRTAATLPRSLNDSRKWLELHLSEYRAQTKALVTDFTRTVETQAEELKAAVELHTNTTTQVVQRIQTQHGDAEVVARNVKTLMENAASEWQSIKTSTMTERERLEKVAQDLDDRFAWQQFLWSVFWSVLTFGFGLVLGLSVHAR